MLYNIILNRKSCTIKYVSLGDEKTIDMGIMQSGDMFGEVALFHSIPRTSTVITNS